jgi:CHAT domain-containing protein
LQLHVGPGVGNGFVDSAALRQLDLHGYGLVVLSACSSGVPELRIDSVTRLAGLATLLLTRGASTVVATLWEIGDDSAALVVDQLFAELLQGDGPKDVPKSLKRAVQHVQTMPPTAVAARFQDIAAAAADASVAAIARHAARRHAAPRVRAPFGTTDQWGAFFTVGARFIEFGSREVP